MGYDVLFADSGMACLTRIREAAPELVVLDTDLRWGGAEGVVAVLAEDATLPPIKIVLISPRLNRTVLYELSRFAVNDYGTKPVSGTQLLSRVQAMVGTNAVESAACSTNVTTRRC